MSKTDIKKLIEIFEEANKLFIKNNKALLKSGVCEMTLCGALMIELHEALKKSEYGDYSVDVEYNKIYGDRIKAEQKTIEGPKETMVSIRCDLIVHRRGRGKDGDNLIALEMKKTDRSESTKKQDRRRLKILTTPRGVYYPKEIWKSIPNESIFGYKLGIFYEVDMNGDDHCIEYYQNGELYRP